MVDDRVMIVHHTQHHRHAQVEQADEGDKFAALQNHGADLA